MHKREDSWQKMTCRNRSIQCCQVCQWVCNKNACWNTVFCFMKLGFQFSFSISSIWCCQCKTAMKHEKFDYLANTPHECRSFTWDIAFCCCLGSVLQNSTSTTSQKCHLHLQLCHSDSELMCNWVVPFCFGESCKQKESKMKKCLGWPRTVLTDQIWMCSHLDILSHVPLSSIFCGDFCVAFYVHHWLIESVAN